MNLLVDLHLKFENISIEDQLRIWRLFIEKCMKIIETGSENAYLIEGAI